MSELRPLLDWLLETIAAGGLGVLFYFAALRQRGALGIAVRLIAAFLAAVGLAGLALFCFLFRDWGDAPYQLDPPRRGKEALANAIMRVGFWIGPIGVGALFAVAAALFARAALRECDEVRSCIYWMRRRRACDSSAEE